jgi:hypothetical protein
MQDVYIADLVKATAKDFHAAITKALKFNKWHASVHIYTEQEYELMQCWLSQHCGFGYAVDGDNLVSVFKHPDYKTVADIIVPHAIMSGARRLDVFDTVLPELYGRYGFVETSRVTWDDQYAPHNWNYGMYHAWNGGRPDVVFLELARQ